MPLAAPPDDADLIEACGEDPGTVCETVFDATDSEGWAKAADWFIGRPLSVLLILIVAWLVAWLSRRAVRKAVRKLVAADHGATSWARRRMGQEPVGEVAIDPRRAGRAASIAAVIASGITVIVWVVALLLVLGEFDINLAPVIAATGIAGVALGFGAQSLVKDCITGLFMLIEDQYGIGDEVDLGEASGTVERVSLRSTVLRGADGTAWHVPNGEVVRVGNRSQSWTVALLDVAVALDADIDAASRVLKDAAVRVCESEEYAADVLEAPELLGVESMTAEGVTLRLRVKTRPGRQYALQRALREAIKEALDRAGIPLPPRVPWQQTPGQSSS